MKPLFYTAFMVIFGSLAVDALAGEVQNAGTVLVCPKDAPPLVQLAALEIQRYAFLRTGTLLPIHREKDSSSEIVVCLKDHKWTEGLDTAALNELGEQEYWLRTLTGTSGTRRLYVVGGGELGTLYGAYQLAEKLGVRFYLDSDVIPDTKIPLGLPELNESGKPLFELRGIQPFHDFPEGPDWWNPQDYLAILAQLPKLRMNFFGLHTYPEDRPAAEPCVWIGRSQEVNADGTVKSAYPAIWYNTTLAVGWGYQPKKTSDYSCGAGSLYDRDDFGCEVMRDLTPKPDTPEECVEVFARAGAMFKDAFTFARQLGIKTCIGTETPLVTPRDVARRMTGKDDVAALTPENIAELYEGIYTRISNMHPLDYYWFWTPENWTWEKVSEEVVNRTIDDLKIARAAWEKVKPPFQLATCGWVLGPQYDRAYLDKMLPRDMAVSCINRQVGHDPVEPGFAKVEGRGKWAIPWLEDDPAMSQIQLWAGRMRRDARDALKYGCTGLMGIHWRTRILGPNVSSLAKGAWDQTGWIDPAATESGVLGGTATSFNHPFFDSMENGEVYRSVRWDVAAYRLVVPNGTYKVTLQFCEPHYREKEKRVFGVKLEDNAVIENLDIFARVGANTPLDVSCDTEVNDGRLDIDFVKQTEFPSIAGIVVEGTNFSQKINCGGEAYKDYGADLKPLRAHPRADDFYADWALAEFGPEIATDAATIFSEVDGALPRPSNWIGGPGGYDPDKRPWAEAGKEYVFVDALAALSPRVKGFGNQERFNYWLNNFRMLRAAGKMRCAWAEFNAAFEPVKKETDADKKKQLARESVLPKRIALVQAAREAFEALLATVSTYGEMGNVTNLEQHTFPTMLEAPGKELADILGEPLPAEALLPAHYTGAPRVIVPTKRGLIRQKEDLAIKAIWLDAAPAISGTVRWRALGESAFENIPMNLAARQTYTGQIPAKKIGKKTIEYFVEMESANGAKYTWPVTAPDINQTVVVKPGE
ncbi:MAG TPA: malectin domain-containing carbohydrate-binding protein [Candidatus Hydrogenedentes bacterium]|nr:malectin domain-containing carbohydrate-binding protein [Candidatus Hydrogenedentota bacterium]